MINTAIISAFRAEIALFLILFSTAFRNPTVATVISWITWIGVAFTTNLLPRKMSDLLDKNEWHVIFPQAVFVELGG
jgi:hypothetical protein